MSDRRMTVHEVAGLTGITIRTLHYYDEIGLLKPTMVTDSKYRLYTDDDLSRLQEILFFRCWRREIATIFCREYLTNFCRR